MKIVGHSSKCKLRMDTGDVHLVFACIFLGAGTNEQGMNYSSPILTSVFPCRVDSTVFRYISFAGWRQAVRTLTPFQVLECALLYTLSNDALEESSKLDISHVYAELSCSFWSSILNSIKSLRFYSHHNVTWESLKSHMMIKLTWRSHYSHIN